MLGSGSRIELIHFPVTTLHIKTSDAGVIREEELISIVHGDDGFVGSQCVEFHRTPLFDSFSMAGMEGKVNEYFYSFMRTLW